MAEGFNGVAGIRLGPGGLAAAAAESVNACRRPNISCFLARRLRKIQAKRLAKRSIIAANAVPVAASCNAEYPCSGPIQPQTSDGGYPVHQNFVARRCDPSHAGADGSPCAATGWAIHVDRGGGFCAARATASRG